MANSGIEILRKDRLRALSQWNELRNERTFVAAIKNVKVKNIISTAGRNSLIYFHLHRSGRLKLGQLSNNDITNIERFTSNKNFLCAARGVMNINRIEGGFEKMYPKGKGLVNLSKLTSNSIRLLRCDDDPITIFKAGLILSPNESLSYMNKVRKLTSTRHKNIILKYLHGEVYTNERLVRFGLSDDPNCALCGQNDSLDHRLTSCQRTINLVEAIEEKTRSLRNIDVSNHDNLMRIFAAYNDTDLATLAIHAELLMYLSSNKNENPTSWLSRTITSLIRRDNNGEVKDQLRSLFDR